MRLDNNPKPVDFKGISLVAQSTVLLEKAIKGPTDNVEELRSMFVDMMFILNEYMELFDL